VPDAQPRPLPTTLGRPARRALVAAGYSTLDELDGVSSRELLALHGFGPRGIRLLNEALAPQGRLAD